MSCISWLYDMLVVNRIAIVVFGPDPVLYFPGNEEFRDSTLLLCLETCQVYRKRDCQLFAQSLYDHRDRVGDPLSAIRFYGCNDLSLSAGSRFGCVPGGVGLCRPDRFVGIEYGDRQYHCRLRDYLYAAV